MKAITERTMGGRFWLVGAVMIAMAALLSGCGEDTFDITVTVTDDLGNALSAIDIYVNTGATPRTTTNGNGQATLSLSGTNDVIVVDPLGLYSTYSFLNRKWDLVIALPVTLHALTSYPLGANGTLTYALAGGVADATAIVTAASREKTVTQTATLDSTGTLTGQSISVPPGDYYLTVTHATDITANADSFFGTAGPFTVPASGTYNAGTLALQEGGKLFDQVSVSGGLDGAELTLGYQVYRLPGELALLAANRTADFGATDLTGETVVPPSNTVNMGNASFMVDAVSSEDTSGTAESYDELRRALAFPDQPEMQQANRGPTLALVDYGILYSAPSNSTGVVFGQFPDFVFIVDNDAFPDFVEVQVYQVETAGSDYNLVHTLRTYTYTSDFADDAATLTLPAQTGGLVNAAGSYRFHIAARKLGYAQGELSSVIESSVRNVCFTPDGTAASC